MIANCNHWHLNGHFQAVCRKIPVLCLRQEEPYQDNTLYAEDTLPGSVTMGVVEYPVNRVQLCVDSFFPTSFICGSCSRSNFRGYGILQNR